MSWTVSWDDFKSYVDKFVIVSDELGDGWAWQGNKDLPGGAFISKKVTRPLAEDIPLPLQDEKDAFEDCSLKAQLQDEHAFLEEYKCCRGCTWEYHILYSLSYATPVLYFNAFTADGRLLPLQILWKGSEGHEALQQMRWEALSQQEHPILRRPFFQLHPCKTAEFLSHHQGSSCNPVVTWLSSTGPAVGLQLHIAYGRLVQETTKVGLKDQSQETQAES